MKFWGVSKKNWGVRLINFMAFWGREGGLPKMFENIFLENDGYSEQKTKMKNTKKMQRSPHKWVWGETLQKLKWCLGKNSREFCLCVCVCDGVHLPRKEGKVKILHLPPKKTPSTAPSHLAS